MIHAMRPIALLLLALAASAPAFAAERGARPDPNADFYTDPRWQAVRAGVPAPLAPVPVAPMAPVMASPALPASGSAGFVEPGTLVMLDPNGPDPMRATYPAASASGYGGREAYEAELRAAALRDRSLVPPPQLQDPEPEMSLPPVDLVQKAEEHRGFGSGILIDISDRRLYYFVNGQIVRDFPLGIPRPGEPIYYGDTRVNQKRVNPDWRPTANMRRQNPRLPAYVPGGPGNPMGTRALYLGWPYIRIHGTNKPRSIGGSVSSGCFRMLNEDVEWLYDQVPVQTLVRVVA